MSKYVLGTVLLSVLSSGCLFGSKDGGSETAAVASTSSGEYTGQYLYVTSGACFNGAATAGNRYLTRFNLETGTPEVVYDFSTSEYGIEQPGGMVDMGDSIMVAVNTNNGGVTASDMKHLYKINKTTHARTPFYIGSAVTTANLMRGLIRSSSDGSFLVAAMVGAEKFAYPAATRVTNASNTTYVSSMHNTAATNGCPTAALGANVTAIAETLVNKNYIIGYGAGTAQKILVIDKAGWNGAASSSCLGGITPSASGGFTAPTTALTTSVLMHSSGKVLASMGSAAAPANNNAILAFDLNESATIATNQLSNQVVAYMGGSINRPTAMVEVPGSGDVLIAVQSTNSIERFSFDSTTKTLTPTGSFVGGTYASCIVQMFIGQ